MSFFNLLSVFVPCCSRILLSFYFVIFKGICCRVLECRCLVCGGFRGGRGGGGKGEWDLAPAPRWMRTTRYPITPAMGRGHGFGGLPSGGRFDGSVGMRGLV